MLSRRLSVFILNGMKVCLLVVGLLLPIGVDAMAKDTDYEAIAAACHQDGTIFVAVGRAVLAIPASQYRLIQASPDPPNAKPPFQWAPPDANQPEGCYRHPIALSGIGRGNAVFLPPEYSAPQPFGPSQSPVIYVGNIGIFRYFPHWRLSGQAAGMSNDEAELMCHNKDVHIEVRNDVRLCRYKSEDDKTDERRGGSYQVPQSLMKTFTGQDLAFTCSSISYFVRGLAPCGVVLVIDIDLIIAVKFSRPANYSEDAFPKQVIELLEKIIREIEAAKQTNYPWPEP